MITLLAREWHNALRMLATHATTDAVVCSPYVRRDGVELLASGLSATFRGVGSLTLITDLSPSNVYQGSTDPRALQSLRDCAATVSIRHLPGVHAKVYIADNKLAIVTSGNLTAGGLYRNFEYGVEVRSRSVVQRVRSDILEYGALGADIPVGKLAAYCEAADELRDLFDEQRKSIALKLRRQFSNSLQKAEDSLLHLRLAGGAIHTVFARTILYLLRTYGPLTTERMHPIIQSIHPDLCDDSIDRVIDGKRFGKKWKHAVRTAQQQLKKQEAIRYEDGRWRLV